MTASRQNWMALLATAKSSDLFALWPDSLDPQHVTLLRPPERGLVMARGRIGGSGAPFNLGEVSVTRCSVRLSCGMLGHAYVMGRNAAHARKAAILDALMQTDQRDVVEARIIAPLAKIQREIRQTREEKTAATKVDFFTLVRGDV